MARELDHLQCFHKQRSTQPVDTDWLHVHRITYMYTYIYACIIYVYLLVKCVCVYAIIDIGLFLWDIYFLHLEIWRYIHFKRMEVQNLNSYPTNIRYFVIFMNWYILVYFQTSNRKGFINIAGCHSLPRTEDLLRMGLHIVAPVCARCHTRTDRASRLRQMGNILRWPRARHLEPTQSASFLQAFLRDFLSFLIHFFLKYF